MHEVGSIVNGKVTGITQFGAFVELDDGTVGMVHISEVSQTYVNDISEHLKANQEVKVKILALNDGKKISLSIKKAMPPQPRNNNNNYNKGDRDNRNNNNRGGNNNNRGNYNNRDNNNKGSYNNRQDKGDKDDGDYEKNSKFNKPKSTGNNNRINNNNNNNFNNFNRNATTAKGPQNFEDMLSKFMSSSEDKISDIKKPNANRRGGHSSKRFRDYD